MGKKTLNVNHLDTRKMVKQGGSLYISVPMKFCKENGIEEGTSIDIFQDTDGSIVILKKRESTNFNEE